MKGKQQTVEYAITKIEQACQRMKKRENYMQEMPECVSAINDAMMLLLNEKNCNQEQILTLLEDIMYGMSQRDDVFLLDVLRFGLMPGLQEYYHQLGN